MQQQFPQLCTSSNPCRLGLASFLLFPDMMISLNRFHSVQHAVCPLCIYFCYMESLLSFMVLPLDAETQTFCKTLPCSSLSYLNFSSLNIPIPPTRFPHFLCICLTILEVFSLQLLAPLDSQEHQEEGSKLSMTTWNLLANV